MNLKNIKSKLDNYHRKKVVIQLNNFSDIAGNQFPGEFNVSGFHKQILALPNEEQSIWGIDRCLRIQEIIDTLHSHIFHMGIFAKSINLQNNFINPFGDSRFFELQKEILAQFFEVLGLFKINLKEIEVSYLDGLSFGGSLANGNKLLKRIHKFPSDIISRNFLKDKVKLFPVKSIANLDIDATENSLVGLRLEIAYKGIEIGTVVFDCFRIKQGNLVPINYVSGYAIGIERLAAALVKQTFIEVIPRHNQAAKLLLKNIKTAGSSLFAKEVLTIIFIAEAIALIPDNLSEKQNERLRKLKKTLRENLINLGAGGKILNSLVNFFKKWKYL